MGESARFRIDLVSVLGFLGKEAKDIEVRMGDDIGEKQRICFFFEKVILDICYTSTNDLVAVVAKMQCARINHCNRNRYGSPLSQTD